MTGRPSTIGPYTVTREIGRGGMGVVYLAHDSRLDRDVAIKALPEELAGDPERLARFQREAKALASLNHPNVASIYGLEEDELRQYLVLEYVEGQTLRDRLRRGPIPMDEAIEIATRIAGAVEAAHDRGVIHRDLKPGNVMVTTEGRVKVVDFGLARMTERPTSASPAATGESTVGVLPDQPPSPTIAGAIMGTAGYMSPEQARGKIVDQRSDLFSFGCVLYEMLTGEPPFQGETVTDTLAATLHKEVDLGRLPAGTPSGVRRLLRRCLVKDREKRLRDMGDARIELNLAGHEEEAAETSASRGVSPRWVAVGGVVALAVIAGLTATLLRRTSVSPPTRPDPGLQSARVPKHLDIVFPPDAPLSLVAASSALALSPDGRRMAYVGLVEERTQTRLFLRDMTTGATRELPGTEDALGPFFSHDGEWIGFQSGERLWRISAQGELRQRICPAPAWAGGTWGPDKTIVFAPSRGGPLFRVAASGGEPRALTELDVDAGEITHRQPLFLPDGEHILFQVGFEYGRLGQQRILSLRTGEVRNLGFESDPVLYAPTGHLLYLQGDLILALPFDLRTLAIKGEAVPIQSGLGGYGSVHFTVARDGTLAYVPSQPSTNRLARVDRQGNVTEIGEAAHFYVMPRLSSDGQRIAVNDWRLTLPVIDVSSGVRRLIRAGNPFPFGPFWSRDGEHLFFAAEAPGTGWIPHRIRADETGPMEPLLVDAPPAAYWPTDVSMNGRLLMTRQKPQTQETDILVLDVGTGTAAAELRPFLATPHYETAARFSPDGLWVAYMSDETGRFEVYVTDFPDRRSKRWISASGGTQPVWSPDGTELFYVEGNRLMTASVAVEGDTFSSLPARPLFRLPYQVLQPNPHWAHYDVFPNGEAFVLVRNENWTTRAHVITDWFEALPRTAGE
jgi:eukaryotic-like serine/threonine-protein kinase